MGQRIILGPQCGSGVELGSDLQVKKKKKKRKIKQNNNNSSTQRTLSVSLCLSLGKTMLYRLFNFFFPVLGVELRASKVLGQCSTAELQLQHSAT